MKSKKISLGENSFKAISEAMQVKNNLAAELKNSEARLNHLLLVAIECNGLDISEIENINLVEKGLDITFKDDSN